MTSNIAYQPIFIIGAARSGTNMLRDIIAQAPDVATWDCDEINPIWRHGNLSHPNDEFRPEMASQQVKKFVRNAFFKISKRYKATYVLEKTCANSLRVSFLNEIFPNAKYIFIIRDGRDTVASAALRWNAPFDLNYTLKKLRYTPVVDLPYYAMRYGWNRIRQLFSKKSTLGFWGVQIKNIQDHLSDKSLREVCALQWRDCVEKSLEDFNLISDHQIITIKYEAFVVDPQSEVSKLFNFIGIEMQNDTLEKLTAEVSPKSVGKYKSSLKKEELIKIEALTKETLMKLDYL